TRSVSVSLLFTEIEGSGRLMRELGGAYPAALEEHRRSVRAALSGSGGEEMDCRTDELWAGFTEADDAVHAAFAIQEASAHPIRVRIGVHTGEPLRVDGCYVGPDVHRAGRICAAGHGGQVLLSEPARAALKAPEVMRDLGFHQLRGLEQPERIYQLGGREFPPLRANVVERGLGARIRVVLAGTADELLLKVRSYKPDVAIIDIRMPPTHTNEGLLASQQIREQHPGV